MQSRGHHIAAISAVRGMHARSSVEPPMWIASYVVHVNNNIVKNNRVCVGNVTKQNMSQSLCPKGGIMVLGDASAWSAQAARNVPHAIMLGTTAALPKKNGKRVTKKGYVWNARLRNVQAIAKSC